MRLVLFTDPAAAADDMTRLHVDANAIVDLTDRDPQMFAVRIPHGTREGRSTVIFHVESEGTVYAMQTSLRLLKTMVAAFKGADERDERAKGGN